MKRFSSLREKSLRKISLRGIAAAAALVFTLAAGGSAFYSDVKASAAAAGTTDAEKKADGADESSILKDALGEVTIYRWKKVTALDYPTDNKWYPSLIFFDPGNGQPKSYLCGKAPGSIWAGPEAGGINGVKKFSDGASAGYADTQRSDIWSRINSSGDIAARESFYILADEAAYGYDAKNRQIDIKEDFFYTSGDLNCVYLQYAGVNNNTNNSGIDGSKPPQYFIKMKKDDPDDSREYYITPGRGESKGGKMEITSSPTRPWTFRSLSSKEAVDAFFSKIEAALKAEGLSPTVSPRAEIEAFISRHPEYSEYQQKGFDWVVQRDPLWHIFNDWPGTYDPMLAREQMWFKVEDTENESNYSNSWYIGEELRFSAVKSNYKIAKDRILEITSKSYVADGEKSAAEGVILQSGDTLTIEKGGILSISGTFINNGTIINNGGTILVKDGGTINPFLQGTKPAENGCGSIKCNGGDIIIQPGGAVYAGLTDENCYPVPFWLDGGSTLINRGLLVYGNMRLGNAARVELYPQSKTLGSVGQFEIHDDGYMCSGKIDKIKDANEKMKAMIDLMLESPNVLIGFGGDNLMYPQFQHIRFKKSADMLKYANEDLMTKNVTGAMELKQYEYYIGMYIADGVKERPHVYTYQTDSKDTDAEFNDPRRKDKSIQLEHLDI